MCRWSVSVVEVDSGAGFAVRPGSLAVEIGSAPGGAVGHRELRSAPPLPPLDARASDV